MFSPAVDASHTASGEPFKGELKERTGEPASFKGELEEFKGGLEPFKGELGELKGEPGSCRSELEERKSEPEPCTGPVPPPISNGWSVLREVDARLATVPLTRRRASVRSPFRSTDLLCRSVARVWRHPLLPARPTMIRGDAT